jgi:hypothetical protein
VAILGGEQATQEGNIFLQMSLGKIQNIFFA